jgi:signal transduction histidine kinase
LADTFLASVLVSIYAASRSIRLDLKSIADQEVETEIKSELAKFQSYFLSGFSTWVSATTETITHLVRSSPAEPNNSRTNQALHERLFLAASDLNEYLTGINQLSTADENTGRDAPSNAFDVRQMVQSILRRFDVKAQSRGITFAIDIEDQVAVINSNVQFVDAILFNFISNAVKYANAQSTIEIRVFPERGRSVVFSVTDDGPGIEPELQARVFERFYRINDERLYAAKGTGVGLYLCKYFAESLGGRVELDSSVGIGSEFRAVIPWKK